MGTIWTPSGERPVPPRPADGERSEETDRTQPAAAATRHRPPGPAQRAGTSPAGEELNEEELAEQMAELQRELAQTPASVVIANHCIGLFHLGALHLNRPDPNLEEAQLAIDALAAIVEGLGPRLGDDAPSLKDALAQLRLAFVQVKAATAQQS